MHSRLPQNTLSMTKLKKLHDLSETSHGIKRYAEVYSYLDGAPQITPQKYGVSTCFWWVYSRIQSSAKIWSNVYLQGVKLH